MGAILANTGPDSSPNPSFPGIPMPEPLPKFCVVIPCFNEQESIPVLVEKLVPHLEAATQGSWRILFVDDGSQDATAQMIWDLHARDPRFHGVSLSRNFGHQPA